jgi:hypothetical protein
MAQCTDLSTVSGGNPLVTQEKHVVPHDGAAAHFTRQVWEHLTATYKDRWIGQGRPVAWPPRSLDHTPLDFFLLGYMKTLIYSSPVDSEEDLIACLIEAAETWHF